MAMKMAAEKLSFIFWRHRTALLARERERERERERGKNKAASLSLSLLALFCFALSGLLQCQCCDFNDDWKSSFSFLGIESAAITSGFFLT